MKKNLNTIISVFVILILVVIGFFLLRNYKPKDVAKDTEKTTPPATQIRQVDANDHILGNKNARIQIVEYSDPQCPYCKVFYATMKKITEEKSNEIAWIQRHYPIPQLHTTSKKDSEAEECAYEQGEDDAYWAFADELYLGNYENSDNKLTQIAKKLNLDIDQFENCLSTEKYKEKVEKDINDGNNAQVTGTPTSIILVDGEIKAIVPGALPYETMSAQIDKLIDNN